MSYTALRHTFHTDAKIRKLGLKLNIEEAHAGGLMANLWSWCLSHAPDGDLTKFDADDIEWAAKWKGEPGKFVRICVEVRLIDEYELEGITHRAIHNWLVHGGSYAEAQRKRLERKRKKERAQVVQDCPGQSGTVQDRPGLSRLEESRVEENRKKHIRDSSDADAPGLVLLHDRVKASQEPLPLTPSASKPETKPEPKPKSTSNAADVQEVWKHFRTRHPKAAKILRPGRKEHRLIADRLQDGYSVTDLKLAADGYHKSPWHTGDNPRGKRYLSPDLIYRSISHVQQGLEMLDEKPRHGGQNLRSLG